MSTWGSVAETGFLYGDVPAEDGEAPAPWFRAGGNFRGVTLDRQPTGRGHVKRTIPMQADLELGFDSGRTTAVFTLGFRARVPGENKLDEFFSRRHYLLYRLDDISTVRVGKFMPAIGLGGADHVSATRRGLGWDQGSESLNLEYSYLSETLSHQLTLLVPHQDSANSTQEKGVAFTTSRLIGDDSKLGLSAFVGEKKVTADRRMVLGPFWIWSLTEDLYLSSEVFFQSLRPAIGTEKKGYGTFQRLSYEVAKGVTPFLQFDRAYLDENDRAGKFETAGVGVRWLPRPHYDLMIFLGNEKSGDLASTPYCYAMAHIYL